MMIEVIKEVISIIIPIIKSAGNNRAVMVGLVMVPVSLVLLKLYRQRCGKVIWADIPYLIKPLKR